MIFLGQVINSDKLPKLEELNLSHNVLTDCLGDMLSNKHECLNILKLCNTMPSTDYVKNLTEAVKDSKVIRYVLKRQP